MRIVVPTLLIVVMSCSDSLSLKNNATPNDHAKYSGPGDRPSDDSEGVPGYLTKLSLITFARQGNLLQVRGSAGAIEITDGFIDFYINILQVPKNGFYEASDDLKRVDAAIAESMPSEDNQPGDSHSGQQPQRPADAQIKPTRNDDNQTAPSNQNGTPENGDGGGNSGENSGNDNDNSGDGQNLYFSGGAQLTSITIDGILRDSVKPSLDGSFLSTFEIDPDNNDPFVVVIGELEPNKFVNIFASSSNKIDRVFFNPYSKSTDKVPLDAEFIRQIPVSQEIAEAVEASAMEGAPDRFDTIEFDTRAPIKNIDSAQVPTTNSIQQSQTSDSIQSAVSSKPRDSPEIENK